MIVYSNIRLIFVWNLKLIIMKAHEKLSQLWYDMKDEGNCTEYVDEMISQLETLGTETNTLTKEMIRVKLFLLLDKLAKQI
jgi:hypothetical protein